jgi:hypothetical protein
MQGKGGKVGKATNALGDRSAATAKNISISMQTKNDKSKDEM